MNKNCKKEKSESYIWSDNFIFGFHSLIKMIFLFVFLYLIDIYL